jgi:hypothetical protein
MSEDGRKSSGRTTGPQVSESKELPSLASTIWVGIRVGGSAWQSSGVLMVEGRGGVTQFYKLKVHCKANTMYIPTLTVQMKRVYVDG